MCHEIIDTEGKLSDKETKTVTTNFNEKNATCKTKDFYILLAFFLITITLLIAVSIYYYRININQNKNIYYHITLQITILKIFILIIYYKIGE